MRLLLLFICSMARVYGVSAQHNEFTLAEEYKEIKGFAGVDALGNIYSIRNGVLYKKTPDKMVSSFSNHQWGRITSVDASDPLNIIVFFKDFGNIALLDRNLIPKNILDGPQLNQKDIASLVGHSSQDGFWAFFPNIAVIARFSNNGRVMMESAELHHLLNKIGGATILKEENNKLFLGGEGIAVFDRHANFLFFINHIQSVYFQVKGDHIFYIKEDRLHVYDFFLKEESVFLLPVTDIVNFFVENNSTLFLQTDVSLKKFAFNGVFF